MDRSRRVVAVAIIGDSVRWLRACHRRVGGAAVGVVVGVDVPGGPAARAVVDEHVAVVVSLIADLGGAGEARAVEVVTVVAGGREPRGLSAGLLTERGAAVAVSISVPVPGGRVGRGFVDGGIAVVVHAVARLSRARISCAGPVIAVGRGGHEADGLSTGGLLVQS